MTTLLGTTILILIFKVCNANFNPNENINAFLFGAQNFEFVDLSQTTRENLQKDLFRDGYRFSVDQCLKVQIGTNIDERFYDVNTYETYGSNHDIPLNNLILPLIITDISDQVNGDANFVLHKHHLDYMLNNYFGDTNQPCLIVFKFGWSKHFGEREKYCGQNVNNTRQFPGISEEVAKWITVAYKNIVAVGVDLPGVDPGSSTMFPAVKTLFSAGLYVLTNLKIDQYIPEASCTALVIPPKVKDASSLPARVVAICPKSRMQKSDINLHRF